MNTQDLMKQKGKYFEGMASSKSGEMVNPNNDDYSIKYKMADNKNKLK